MRITNLLAAWHSPGKGRLPQPEGKTPFQEILPLKLKNRVSGKGDKTKEGGCLYEMSLVLACLTENEFENKLCQKQVDNFNDCYQKYRTATFESKKMRERGMLVPGDKTLTHKQIRNLLKIRPMA